MSKNLIKEIIIALLICLAIILVLAVVLYEYMPNNKTLPEKISYTTPSEVTQELVKSGGVDESQVILTYELGSTDMNNYERINNYNPGKTNPFSSYQASTSGENTTTNGSSQTGTTNDNNTTNSGGTSTSNNQNTTNSSGTGQSGYVQDKGTK